jgi:hypothetical protein
MFRVNRAAIPVSIAVLRSLSRVEILEELVSIILRDTAALDTAALDTAALDTAALDRRHYHSALSVLRYRSFRAHALCSSTL